MHEWPAKEVVRHDLRSTPQFPNAKWPNGLTRRLQVPVRPGPAGLRQLHCLVRSKTEHRKCRRDLFELPKRGIFVRGHVRPRSAVLAALSPSIDTRYHCPSTTAMTIGSKVVRPDFRPVTSECPRIAVIAVTGHQAVPQGRRRSSAPIGRGAMRGEIQAPRKRRWESDERWLCNGLPAIRK
jgi:hypothetical protein